MNAIEKAKAEELAARRLRDETDRVIEAVGALLAKRAARAAKPTDLLFHDLRISIVDVAALGDCAAAYALDSEDPVRLKAAFLKVQAGMIKASTVNMTVADFGCALVRTLYPEEVAQ